MVCFDIEEAREFVDAIWTLWWLSPLHTLSIIQTNVFKSIHFIIFWGTNIIISKKDDNWNLSIAVGRPLPVRSVHPSTHCWFRIGTVIFPKQIKTSLQKEWNATQQQVLLPPSYHQITQDLRRKPLSALHLWVCLAVPEWVHKATTLFGLALEVQINDSQVALPQHCQWHHQHL